MMYTRYSYALACCALLLSAVSVARAQAPVIRQLNLNALVGVPQGDFGLHVSHPGYGVNLQFALGLAQMPVSFGVDLGILTYGRERRHEPFSLTVPDVEVRVTTSNNIAMVHSFLRLQPLQGRARPYVDGLFGIKHFFTQTSVGGDEEAVASTKNYGDTGLSYGVGGGVGIRLYDGMLDEKPGQVYLNLGVRYLFGPRVSYLREGDIDRELGSYSFETTRSRTEMVAPQMGVQLRW